MKKLRPAHLSLIEACENCSLPDGVTLLATAARLATTPMAKAALAALMQLEADAERAVKA